MKICANLKNRFKVQNLKITEQNISKKLVRIFFVCFDSKHYTRIIGKQLKKSNF